MQEDILLVWANILIKTPSDFLLPRPDQMTGICTLPYLLPFCLLNSLCRMTSFTAEYNCDPSCRFENDKHSEGAICQHSSTTPLVQSPTISSLRSADHALSTQSRSKRSKLSQKPLSQMHLDFGQVGAYSSPLSLYSKSWQEWAAKQSCCQNVLCYETMSCACNTALTVRNHGDGQCVVGIVQLHDVPNLRHDVCNGRAIRRRAAYSLP